MELWLPTSNWNRKFQAVGNGAFTGSINYAALAGALDRGYATASTDTGHIGDGARWSLGHPEKVTDFAWRSVHEMTVVAKQIISAYYDQGPRFSYWNGCSAGGRQGMEEAQRSRMISMASSPARRASTGQAAPHKPCAWRRDWRMTILRACHRRNDKSFTKQ